MNNECREREEKIMGMLFDIKRVFQKAHTIQGVEKEVCADLFVDIIGAMEWYDWHDVDYEHTDLEWEEKEKQAAIKFLFPES